MSSKIKKSVIFLTRGDSLWAQLELYDKDGNPYVPDPADKIRFAFNDELNMDDPIFTKVIPNDTLLLKIDPEDTKSLEVGDYWYDIEITMSNGFVDTFIPPSRFKVTDEVY